MRELKAIMMIVASVVLAALLGSAGCSQNRVAASPSYENGQTEYRDGDYWTDSSRAEYRGRAGDLDHQRRENR